MALVDVTVKTLDGQNHLFSVPEETTVKNFKDKISGSISIPADTQRLIYRGRVMQDEKPLKDYDLHGKAIHVVQRAPPTAAQPGAGSSRASGNPPNMGRPHPPDGNQVDVEIHVGGINANPSPREARNRVIQAELNLGIINDALDLLQERTGITTTLRRRSSGSQEDTQEAMDTSQPDRQQEERDRQQQSERDRQQQSERGPQGQGQSRRPNGGRQDNATGLMATELADVLDRVLVTSDRITPQLLLYRNYLRNNNSYTNAPQEARNAQELANRVSEAMHAMGHVWHNLSDLMVDMNTETPRRVVAAPMSPFMTGASSMAIPIHMNVLSRANGNPQRQPPQEAAQTPGSTTATTAASTTTTSSSAPQTATFSASTPMQFDIPGLQPGAAGLSMVQDIHAAVVTSDELMGGVDVPLPGGPATTSITVVSATTTDDPAVALGQQQQQQPPPSTATTAAVTSIGVSPSPPAAAVSSAAAVISTSETRSTPASSSSSQPSTSTSSATTASFSYGPTTNVNIIGVPPNVTVGPLPNVPGLPGGVLQNIMQSILSNHVGPPGQPLHVHQNATVGRIRIPLLQTQTGAPNQSRGQQTPTSMDASTATRTNASTNTSQRGPAPTTSTTGTNTSSHNNVNVQPASGTSSSSSIGTGTDPGHGTSSRSTNTGPLGPIIFTQRTGRGQPFITTTTGPQRPNSTQSPWGGAGRQPPSAPNNGNNRQQGPQAASGAASNNGGGGGGGIGRAFMDVTLPCGSHHYQSRSARQMARNARNQGQPQQQVPNLSTMVSGMVGNIMGQIGQARHIRPNGNQQQQHQRQQQQQTTTSSSGSTAATANASATSAGEPMRGMFDPLRMFASMMGGAAPAPGMPAAGGQGSAMPFDLPSMIAGLMGVPPAPGNPNVTGNASPMGGTLADFLQHVRRSMDPNSTENEGGAAESSPLQGLIEAVAPHLRLLDILSLLMGNAQVREQVLAQVQGPMRGFVERGVAEHGSMEAFVSVTVDGVMEEINYLASQSQVKADIDLAASLRKCLLTHLERIFPSILGETITFAMWKQMFAEVVALFIYCLQDGTAGLPGVVQRYLPHLTQDLNPALTTMMITSLQDMLGSFHQNNPVPEDTLLRYVMRHPPAVKPSDGASKDAAGPNRATTTAANDKPKESAPTPTPTTTTNVSAHQEPLKETATTPKSDHKTPAVTAAPAAATTATTVTVPPAVTAVSDATAEAMDTSVSPASRPPRAKVARTHEDTESDEEFVDAPREFALSQSPRVKSSKDPPSDNQSSQPVTNGENSDQWQSVIPQEWIPVISRDIERQRDQRPQAPLSDAYLQGLPPKRRRMMVLEHAAEMSNMHHYLPSSVARAARAAGVEPISSEQNLVQEATEEKELQDSLEEEMQASLEDRLSNDSDFNADRFPNSKEYFHKSKRH